MSEHIPFISVIIPTYNRVKTLGITIESFMAQSYPKELFEIIISDNNSFDNTKEVVSEWESKSIVPIRYLFEGRQGVHYARNSAAKIAEGDMLYFTDDDMIADVNLLKEIIKPFAIDDKVAAATGRILPKWEGEPPEWVLELCTNALLSLMDRPEALVISSTNCDIYSCHQALRRDVFFQSGGFNPENTDGEWIGDGETGLNIKIRQLGYKFAYIGSSVIYHMIPASRMTQSYLNKRLGNQGNCDSYTAYRQYRYNEATLYKKLFDHFLNIVKNYRQYIIKKVLSKNEWRINRAYLSYYFNRIKYDYKLIKNENWRKLVLKNDWLG